MNGSIMDATFLEDLTGTNQTKLDMFYRMAQNKSVHSLQDGYTGLAYVCRGVLGYETSDFILQARAASAILSDVRINGYPLVVMWETAIDTNTISIPWTGGGDYVQIFNNNKQAVIQALDPHNDACIVGLETSQSLGAPNILGLAYLCGACDGVNYDKLFMVGTNVDDSIAFATILHEVLHLFCAVHTNEGVMRPYMTEDSNIAMIPESTLALVENMIVTGAPCVSLASDFASYSPPDKNNEEEENDNTNMYIALAVSIASVSIIGVVLI